MSGEECIVNVGRVSASESDDEWIDVGADETLGMSGMDSDFLDEEEGAEGTSRKGHHNELEKKRRSTLNNSYLRLTRIVKRINPKLAKTKMGRDKTLKIALSQLKTGLERIKINKAEARSLIEELKKERSETDNEEEKKELDKDISELETYVNQKIVIENYPEDKELPWGGQEEEEDQKEEVEEEEEPEGSDEDEDSWVSDDDPDHSSSQSCATVDNDDTTSHVSP